MLILLFVEAGPVLAGWTVHPIFMPYHKQQVLEQE
jgi:hypothetical protein